MNRVGGAIAGGVGGTAVMSTLLLFLDVQMRSAILVFSVIARFVGMPGNETVGFAVFVLAGSVAWPLIFLGLEEHLPGGPDPATRGVIFATALWIVFVITGRGDLSGPILPIYAGFTLFAHWAYGFFLGVIYGRFTDDRTDVRDARYQSEELP